VTFKLNGGPELLAFLDQLPLKLQKNVLRGAMRAGARVVQKEAKLRVPAKSGLTRKSIKVDTGVENGRVIGRVLARGRHAYLARMIERGIDPHIISISEEDRGTTMTRRGPRVVSIGTVNKMVKRGSLKIGEHFVGPIVHHPGVAARPFMRPALDIKAKEAVGAIGQYIAARLKFGQLNAPLLETEGDEE
jgi:HK97 gp10 family phage protein